MLDKVPTVDPTSNRLALFSDDEVYVLKRAFLESASNILANDLYIQYEKKLYAALLNELVKEDSVRLYGNKWVKEVEK